MEGAKSPSTKWIWATLGIPSNSSAAPVKYTGPQQGRGPAPAYPPDVSGPAQSLLSTISWKVDPVQPLFKWL